MSKNGHKSEEDLESLRQVFDHPISLHR